MRPVLSIVFIHSSTVDSKLDFLLHISTDHFLGSIKFKLLVSYAVRIQFHNLRLERARSTVVSTLCPRLLFAQYFVQAARLCSLRKSCTLA